MCITLPDKPTIAIASWQRTFYALSALGQKDLSRLWQDVRLNNPLSVPNQKKWLTLLMLPDVSWKTVQEIALQVIQKGPPPAHLPTVVSVKNIP